MSSDEQRVAERPRVAFITGAAGGIGRGIAEHLAELGYSISLSDISETGLRAVAKDITEATGVAMSTSAADLADRESVQAAVDATVSRLGALDVLVNSAGILKDARIEKMEPAFFRQVLDVNMI
jgi:3-oxoacyl-[acyl-carrier protein] reductase